MTSEFHSYPQTMRQSVDLCAEALVDALMNRQLAILECRQSRLPNKKEQPPVNAS